MNPDTDCLACEGKNPVNWLLTRLNPSATIRVCEQDIAQAAVALLATEIGVDADWLTGVINQAIEGATAQDGGHEATDGQDDDDQDDDDQDDDEEYPVVTDE